MFRLWCVLIGYGFGLIQTAFILGKMNGIDIREHGSGNAGTTNTLRVLGTKAGLIVFAGDLVKCVLAVLCCGFIFKNVLGDSYEEFRYLIKLYAAAGAILGHNFPFYLNFKGGKGIASTAGLILSFSGLCSIVGAVMFFGSFLTTHYVSLGSLMMYLGFFVQMVIMGQMGLFGASRPVLIEMYAVTFALLIMAFYRHRENIKRLLSGTERKTYLSKKGKEKEAERTASKNGENA
ncbi:MAG: glycerol-3-phosphate 1-O-acyltransferase PlsY [Lachnospiraceae bacterium]|nr:glycerol-3-phosphate 1-O-acyltransferase PlsY [Lachnospiraceae bacterium]